MVLLCMLMAKKRAYYLKKMEPRNRQRYLWVVGIVVVALLVGLAVVKLTHNHHPSKQSTTGDVTAQPTRRASSSSDKNTESGSSQKSTSSSDSSNAKSPVLPGSGSSSSKNLTAPYGQFVSNHHPASVNTAESSVCSTSSRATCIISFTMGGHTISLPAKTTNGSGSAAWSWTPKQLGLSSGSWSVTATAKLSSQQKSAKDEFSNLVIP